MNDPVNDQFSLGFADCVGEIQNFDFTTSPLPANCVSMLRSSVNVHDCSFGIPGSAGYSLMVDGHAPLYDMEITDCEFAGGSSTAPSLKLQDTDPRLERNNFPDCEYYAIWSYLGVFGMDHGAKNSLTSEVDNSSLSRLMYLFNSPVYLECGENNFVYDHYNATGFKFIYYRGSEPALGQGAPNVKNYTRNFWGSDCSSAVSTSGRIPSWADPGTPLTACSDPSQQYNGMLCPEEIELEMAFEGGLEAELLSDISSAKSIYSDLIQNNPGTRVSLAAALRLKGLGFIDENGVTVSELQSLADVTQTADTHLASYLDCAAECVRAWQGDPETAEANLVMLRDEAATEDEAIVAQKDLLEIQTYPVGNGLSSLTGDLFTRLLRARQDLRDFDPEDPFRVQPRGVSAARPQAMKIEMAWPNPFNPVVNLRFHLWKEQLVAVHVYNLQGQLVTTLAEGMLPAGSHVLHWNASMAASGMYILRIEGAKESAQAKVLYLK